jgi:hypothetical protein
MMLLFWPVERELSNAGGKKEKCEIRNAKKEIADFGLIKLRSKVRKQENVKGEMRKKRNGIGCQMTDFR